LNKILPGCVQLSRGERLADLQRIVIFAVSYRGKVPKEGNYDIEVY
jgi:hypothetical protein